MILRTLCAVLVIGAASVPVAALEPVQDPLSGDDRLKVELNRLRAENQVLQAKVAELEAALASARVQAERFQQVIAQSRAEADVAEKRARDATDFLSKAFAEQAVAQDAARQAKEDQARSMLDFRALLDRTAAQSVEPEVSIEQSAAVREALAQAYERIGESQKALEMLKRVVEEKTRYYGEGHQETLDSKEKLLDRLLKDAKGPEAEALLREVLDARQDAAWRDDSPPSSSQRDWSTNSQRDWSTADDMMREKQARLRQDLGGLLLDRGDYQGAEDELRAAVEMLQKGPNDREAQYRLAKALAAQGKLEESLALWQKLIEDLRQERGEDSGEYLRALRDYAAACASSGQYESAEQLLEKALSAQSQQLGREHPETLSTVEMLAQVAVQRGEWARALELARKVLEGRKDLLGDEHPATLRAMADLGKVLLSVGDLDRSLALLQKALDAQHRVVGDDDPSTLRTKQALIEVLEAAGRADEARDLRKSLPKEPAPARRYHYIPMWL